MVRWNLKTMLGVCCQWLEPKIRPRSGRVDLVNVMDERTLQLGRFRAGKYTSHQIKSTYLHNVNSLVSMLPKIAANGIKLFRISSSIFPLADQVERSLFDNAEVRSALAKAGQFVKEHNMRVTTHPGQFCVLSSDSDSVVANAFSELRTHGWMFDAMGLDRTPYYAINIHGGKSDRVSRLSDQIKSLPDEVRNRLTLENDESAYSVIDLLHVHKSTGVPIVWDSHHHVFNDGDLTPEEACDVTSATWPKGMNPLQHISNTEPELANGSFTDRRKHSNMIHYVPDVQLRGLRDGTIDVETEAKLKNIAVAKMRQQFCL